MFSIMKEHPDFVARLKYIGHYIKTKAKSSNLEIYDELQFALDFVCDCKAFLAAMLFYVMGYDVLYLASREYQHAAIGIRVPDGLRDFYNDEKVFALRNAWILKGTNTSSAKPRVTNSRWRNLCAL